MLMNSVTNNDSETVYLVQNWLGAPGAHPTQPASTLRRVAGQAWPGRVTSLARPCRRPRRPYRRCAVHFLRYITALPPAMLSLYCDITSGQASAPLSRYNRLYRYMPSARLPAYHDTKTVSLHNSPSSQSLRLSRYTHLYRDTVPQPFKPSPVTIQPVVS